MDSLIQRWKTNVASGQKSGSFSSRNGVVDDTQRNINTSQFNSGSKQNQMNRSLSGKRNENRGRSYSSSSSSSSESPYFNKRHNQSSTTYNNKMQEDKLDEIFSNSGNKSIDGLNKNTKQNSQGIIKPPLKQHQSPLRNTSQEEKNKLKSLKESYANSKANAQVSASQKLHSQSQILNSNTIANNNNNNTSRSQLIANSPSGNKGRMTSERNMIFYIDESVFRITDIFKIREQYTPQEQIVKVRNILNNLVENCKSFYNLNVSTQRSPSREEYQSESQLKETERTLTKIKQSTLTQKAEQNSKIVQELENKLFECERARIQLKTENEQQQIRIQSLQKEIEQIKETNIVIGMLRESQHLLDKNNKTLHDQLKKEEQKNVEQQRIFETQLQEVQLIIHHLKQQLQQAYSTSPNKQI